MVFLFTLCSCSCEDEKNKKVDNDPAIIAPEGYELVWNDEFEGEAIDLSKWEFEVNAQGGGNNELQYYTSRSENAFINDDKLVIQALAGTYTSEGITRDYTSARMRTKFKGDWLYGWFEVRAKLPVGQGLWPAIWMLPTDWEYGGWAASGEIDIMELLGHEPQKVYGTLHYGGPYPQNVHTGTYMSLSEGNFTDEFHTFAIEWNENEFKWYVDGEHYQTQTNWYSTAGEYPAPFDKRFHIILNVAVGGNWPGNPDDTTIFPQTMEVEYVRVFQRSE